MSDTPILAVHAETVRDLIHSLAQALVNDKDAVSVELASDQAGIIIRLRVSPEDLGKIIGKQGRTARSLRTILQAASMKHKERYSLDIESEAQATSVN